HLLLLGSSSGESSSALECIRWSPSPTPGAALRLRKEWQALRRTGAGPVLGSALEVARSIPARFAPAPAPPRTQAAPCPSLGAPPLRFRAVRGRLVAAAWSSSDNTCGW